MTPTLYPLLVLVHLVAAFVWLGGMFFLALVGAPALRKLEDRELRLALFRELGVRFRKVGWIAIAVLVATGIWILHLRGVLRWEVLSDAAWWGTSFGRALGWKLAAVGVMVGVSAAHDFVLGPGATRTEGPARERARRWSVVLARGNVLVGVVLLYWAARLARGG